MNVKVVRVSLEHRFYLYNGEYYTRLAFPYLYWKDYLRYFDKVEVIARVKNLESINQDYKRVDGENVDVIPMPYYVGLKNFIFKLPSLLFRASNLVNSKDYFILRSGNVSNVLWVFIVLYRKQYLREYPGNVYEGVTGFAGKGIHIKLLAYFLDGLAKKQALLSKANSFVSEDCKAIYSTRKPSYVFSSFNIDEINVQKENYSYGGEFNLVSVGRLEGEKGHKDLISALSKIKIKTKLKIIGDGSQLGALRQQAAYLDVDVDFLGAITDRDKLFKIIADSDLYIIPSHTEGMPRSLLESMAIGMPCIGTFVGGIPEVLNSDYLVQAKKIEALSDLILKVSKDEKLRINMGRENRLFIREKYSRENMDKQKLKFWGELYK
ncbi:glycosyltransferase family 4 protein [Pseudoalteromonas sp. NC201]|uniref:glycosyltransferase family 4 protein n=1 Tax=Pseudoalteromonas sp. NC201 TaxID=1514074 RepID=UPI000C7A548A|nr:glycosyltransferase family 4 protein [Pseudoalteromonas sp. NC201]AUJ68899.1 Putative teichuronic acid biosynthesis glycosyltransferase TuaC [Pseudoalteromonas sp. NC201]